MWHTTSFMLGTDELELDENTTIDVPIIRPALIFNHDCPSGLGGVQGFEIRLTFESTVEPKNDLLFNIDHSNQWHYYVRGGSSHLGCQKDLGSNLITCGFQVGPRDNSDPTEPLNDFGIMFEEGKPLDFQWSYFYDFIYSEPVA